MFSEILILPMLLLQPTAETTIFPSNLPAASAVTFSPSNQQEASTWQQKARARAAVVVIHNAKNAKPKGRQVRSLGKLTQPQYKK